MLANQWGPHSNVPNVVRGTQIRSGREIKALPGRARSPTSLPCPMPPSGTSQQSGGLVHVRLRPQQKALVEDGAHSALRQGSLRTVGLHIIDFDGVVQEQVAVHHPRSDQGSPKAPQRRRWRLGKRPHFDTTLVDQPSFRVNGR